MFGLMKKAGIRLYVDQPLGVGQSVPLTRDRAHYLFGAMRQGVGSVVALFDGRDGEYLAHVEEAGKRGGALVCLERTKPLHPARRHHRHRRRGRDDRLATGAGGLGMKTRPVIRLHLFPVAKTGHVVIVRRGAAKRFRPIPLRRDTTRARFPNGGSHVAAGDEGDIPGGRETPPAPAFAGRRQRMSMWRVADGADRIESAMPPPATRFRLPDNGRGVSGPDRSGMAMPQLPHPGSDNGGVVR